MTLFNSLVIGVPPRGRCIGICSARHFQFLTLGTRAGYGALRRNGRIAAFEAAEPESQSITIVTAPTVSPVRRDALPKQSACRLTFRKQCNEP